jgi:sugar phosphate isomerase/epimerase
MIKFAICNELFQEWPWERICDFAAQAGYDGVEVAPFTLADAVTDLLPDRRAQLRQDAEQVGLDIVGLHWLLVSPTGLYINHPDAELRAHTAQYLADLVDFCGDLGGRIMVLGSPKQRNVVEGLTYEQAWDLMKEALQPALVRAMARGVTICPEALSPAETDFINTAAEARRFVQEVNHPNLRMMLDVKAMSSEGRPVADIIRENGDLLVHVHANDANMRGPGFGETDFAPIAEALRDIGYDGYVSVEVFDFKPDPETIATKSLEYLKRTFRG